MCSGQVTCISPIFLLTCCSLGLINVVLSANLACVPSLESLGYVCVCNSTYCDTIERPAELTAGGYYLYTTSETSPGFTLTTGTFSNDVTSTNNTASKVYVTVNSNFTYQTFKGVGTGFSDSAVYVFNQLPEGSQNNILSSLFGTEGAEYNFGRVPIGDTDFSLSYYSYDDVDGDVNMTYFNITDFEITTKIPFIKEVQARSNRTFHLLATPWNTPDWMKDNNETMPGVFMTSYLEAFANYIIKFFDQYKENGIEFWGVSPVNEPICGIKFEFSMPNIIMYPNQLRAFIRDYLGPMLEDAGYGDFVFLVFDDERPYLKWYSDRLLSDNETAQYIDGFNVHVYLDRDTNTFTLDDFHTNYPDQMLMYTEGSYKDKEATGDSVNTGNWDIAVTYITSLLQSYQHWSQAYMCWNFVLNLEGGPYLQFRQTAPILANTTSGEFYKQPMYYILGHFSKFIQPGSIRIGLTIEEDTSSEASNIVISDESLESGPTGVPVTGNPGPNPTGSGGLISGNPGPNPTGSGGLFSGPSTTDGAPTTSTISTVEGIASVNPDGSKTVIIYNPWSQEVTVVLTDTAETGTITATVQANSLNTFIYWNGTSASTSSASPPSVIAKTSYYLCVMFVILLQYYIL